MKCPSCGYERESAFAFCPQCGTQMQNSANDVNNAQPTPVTYTATDAAPQNEVQSRLLAMLRDKMFLGICVLETAVFALSLLNKNFDVLALLFALWLKADDARNHYGLEQPNIK